MPIRSGLEAIIVFIYCPGATHEYGEKVRGITRLDKLLYLVVMETDLGDFLEEEFKFEAHDYGPYSNEIYDALETLKDADLLTVEKISYPNYIEISDAEIIDKEVIEANTLFAKRELEIYGLSEHGMMAGKKLLETLTPKERNELQRIKEKFNQMPLNELIEYVYSKYPQSALRSVIREKILGESKFGSKPIMTPFKRDEENFRQ